MTLETLRRGPLQSLPLPRMPDFTVTSQPPARRFILRGARETLSAFEANFGLALPGSPMTSASDGNRVLLWLGPDEWLVIAETGEDDLQGALEAGLAGTFYSLVDVSHRQAAVTLEGPRAQNALNFGVALDLDPSAFPIGMVVKTLFVKAEITLWRQGPDLWRMEFARSFADYVRTLLLEASREF